MSVNVKIVDGDGEGVEARVNSHRALDVSLIDPDLPPVGTVSRLRYLSQLVSSAGDGSGTTNMNVDGSSTAQTFTIDSVEEYDIRIMAFVIVIADTAVVHNAFGNVSALANGWDLQVVEAGTTTKLIDAASTGGEVIAQAALSGAFGDGATSHELLNWTGTNDAQLVFFPIGELIPLGLRIGRGTKDRVESVVNDDLTGLTEFTVRALGYRHYA